ncbi:MAG: hypothetical protein QHH43_07700 [Candidatus Saccharicenans sp.]|jgi:asparagine synthase (glutamine-hydrolysing)|nr:hypothetical protein [Candidatus Saccharicenans sp.]MDH7575621.1 hypothetical protein [Candidatus Saccharicenans sp.]
MPGISGFITTKVTGNEENLLQAMKYALLHESSYTQGKYEDFKIGFFGVFSAIKCSFSDCMPVYNEKKDIVMFLTGECYDDQEVLLSLREKSHKFEPGNASYLVHRYEELGESLFKELNGWFHGVILDLRQNIVFIFNDRYGIRRLYIYENPEFIAFASEAKALLRAFPELREVSYQSIGEFLIYDCVLQNRTYFPQIHLLPPGSLWIYQNGKLEKKSYINMNELENQHKLSVEQFSSELTETFKNILPRYFQGGSIGLGLTGGLDTRAIIACRNPEPGELPCYTFTGSYKDILDARIAPKVARACGQNHIKIVLEDEKLIKEYPYWIEKATWISDGLEGTDKADVIYFNSIAREIAPVRMTGKYGSQVLKGIFGFKPRPPVSEIINPDFKPYLKMAEETAQAFSNTHPMTFLLQGAIPWWWNSFVTLETSQIEIRSPFLDNDFIKVLYRAPELPGDFGIKFELNIIARYKPELMNIPTTGTYGGKGIRPISELRRLWILSLMMLDKIYNHEDLPYNLTHTFAGIDKRIITPLHLDQIISGHAEFRRYRRWYRDELSGYIKDMLLNEKTLSRPYWNRKGLMKVVSDHINGRGNYLREIRKALQIELLHRVLIERTY